MTRPYITLSAYAGTPASADASATSQVTPNSPCGTYSVAMLSAEEADTPRSAGLRAIAQLRNRLDTIDEHTRELCNTRHILLRREQLLVQERDELAESLNCIEAALVTRLPSYASSVSQPSTIHDTIGNLNEDKEDSELPYKRQAISDSCDRPTVRKRPSGSNGQASNQGISKLAPLTALGTEPTLVAECPPELMYLLQPSKSLPRPPSSSPPGSHTKTPVPSPRSRSVTRGGIRFPPGSAPRLSRDRSSSPLTQMLPPLVPSSPSSPVARKGYNPIIRGLSPSEFKTPIPRVGAVTTCDIPVSVPPPKLSTENSHGHADLPRLLRPQNGTIPIYLMLNNSPTGWSLANMDPERTPSPPIGAPRTSWVVRSGAHIKGEESGEPMRLEAQGIEAINEKPVYEQGGPASRTRARVNGAGAFNNKGKGRS